MVGDKAVGRGNVALRIAEAQQGGAGVGVVAGCGVFLAISWSDYSRYNGIRYIAELKPSKGLIGVDKGLQLDAVVPPHLA